MQLRHVHAHAHKHTHTHTRTRAHAHAHTYQHTHTYTRTRTCAHVQAHAHAHIALQYLWHLCPLNHTERRHNPTQHISTLRTVSWLCSMHTRPKHTRTRTYRSAVFMALVPPEPHGTPAQPNTTHFNITHCLVALLHAHTAQTHTYTHTHISHCSIYGTCAP